MPAMKDFTTAYDVQANTIRVWAREFGDYLSSGANPPKNKRRRFNDDDATVIDLIATMRQDDLGYEAIHEALAAGDRGQWPPIGYEPAEDAPRGAQAGQALASPLLLDLTQHAAKLEGQLTAVIEERDHLRARNEELERRANVAEERLRLLGVGVTETEPAASEEAARVESEELPAGLLERLRRAIRGG